ncbi:hypothetical protein VCM_00023 [Pseudomonas phage VCM]|uniref:Uncharacterized protein n=1 Tax=Pseudomonas phage VCM TaxID=1729937 RepID=A0A0S4L1E6_9CAUD|nr:hypothetical protein VCM_00023 [Pseudomonas phage VCM]CUR44242.1 hypothetical protein VCM_00023 [Pseudomonas phage VCM]
MINIADKIWAVKAVGRGDLAYMCPYHVKRDGTPDSATAKMMKTGQNWANVPARYEYVRDAAGNPMKNEQGHYIQELRQAETAGEVGIYDNVPMKGFKVGSDATRWTTENKVFRLHDPRGFTVEIPTGNLSTLIQTCTIINGEIMDECVWGREGCHILLPINAPEYKEVVKEIEKVDEALKLKDLKPGDWVKMHQHGSEGGEVQFVGMVKLEWTQHRQLYDVVVDRSSPYRYSSYLSLKQENYRDDDKEVLRDSQWVGLFATTVQEECFNGGTHHGGQIKWTYSDPVSAVYSENSTVKITSRRSGELPEEFKDLNAMLKRVNYYTSYSNGRRDCPERVVKKFAKQESRKGYYDRVAAKDQTEAFYTATVYQEAKYD